MKKINNVLLILVLVFAFTFALPQKEIAAAPIAAGAAVPVGITIGAGAYTVGAIALAGLVGIAGYDTYSEEINQHALDVWDSGTQLSKDSMNAMINASIGAGTALTSVDAGFNTWMESQMGNIQDHLAKTRLGMTSSILGTPDALSNGIMNTTYDGGRVLSVGKSDNTGAAIFVGRGYSDINKIEILMNWEYKYIFIQRLDGTRILTHFKNWSAAQVTSMQNQMAAAVTLEQVLSLFAAYGYGVMSLNTPEAMTAYNDGVSKTREAWQDMKDAGLVLPVDNVVPTYAGNAVNYNAETDVYTGVDGGVVSSGDLTWSFPQPRVRTGEELDIPLPPGVYVDNPSTVYNPPLPTTAVPDIAIPTTTNITTGVTTEIPKTTTGDPPPTGGTTPKGEPVNPFNAKPIPIAALTGLFQLLAALIFYLIRLFTFIATLAFIAPTPIENPYFLWFIDATFYGIKPFPLVRNLALFFLGFSVYRSVRRVFG